MGRRSNQIKVENLVRFLSYVLGNRPDEFGLVPDDEGFVKIKELLKAFHEEPGWRYVRHSHLNEIMIGEGRTLFQTEGKRIRALERKYLPAFSQEAESVPGTLYSPIRKKAHPLVMEKGLQSPPGGTIVLCAEKQMAERIGARHDQGPVILEIASRIARQESVRIYAFGNLFLASYLPASCIAGPPVSRELLESLKEEEAARPRDPRPGTFVMESRRDPAAGRAGKGRKKKGWKEDARKMRRR